jgi:transposase
MFDHDNKDAFRNLLVYDRVREARGWESSSTARAWRAQAWTGQQQLGNPLELGHESGGKRKFGYSRDKRPDCVQIVIGLIITPEGFPIAYEVMSGNTSDKTTLPTFLEKIEKQYGKVGRTWIMDRGIPTEEVLTAMRENKISYLVGTPKGRLTSLEKELADKAWENVRLGVDVKMITQGEEVYVLARSVDRVAKERSMRKRQLKKFWNRLKELQARTMSRDQLLLNLGAIRNECPQAARLVEVTLPEPEKKSCTNTFSFALRKDKLRDIHRREGRYLLRSNLTDENPARLWNHYMQLSNIEEAFRNLKGDLALRPIFHQKQDRIEAHVFVSFIAYCLHVTLRNRIRPHASGITTRSILEKFSKIQMLDVHLPTTDGKTIILSRYTQPEKDTKILLHSLNLQLPDQPPPKITTHM